MTASTGKTVSGCWRVIGDAIYLTGTSSVLQDTMIPSSQFEGSLLPAGKVVGTTAPTSRQSGPSGNYDAGRIRAAIRPNIVYPDAGTVPGNPSAEFDINLAADGTVVSVNLRKSSGVPGWDEAAERAIRKTDKLPRDVDGRIHSPLVISLRPMD